MIEMDVRYGNFIVASQGVARRRNIISTVGAARLLNSMSVILVHHLSVPVNIQEIAALNINRFGASVTGVPGYRANVSCSIPSTT